MRKSKIFLGVALLATSVFTACKPNEPSGNDNTPEKIGVKINGVVWSPYNVGTTGTFVAKAEDYGGLYQWNRKDTANFLIEDGYYASDYPITTSWLSANDPSPAGWRVPTCDELRSLFETEKVEYEWTTKNGINGGHFTDKATGKNIFLPAAGGLSGKGLLFYVGEYGNYWSSTSYKSTEVPSAYILVLTSDYASAGSFYNGCVTGFSVRPVAK